jgi:hypothetical protein
VVISLVSGANNCRAASLVGHGMHLQLSSSSSSSSKEGAHELHHPRREQYQGVRRHYRGMSQMRASRTQARTELSMAKGRAVNVSHEPVWDQQRTT